ncbi:MAG TPA: hypothetical protein VLG27_02905 [Candidatus Saccharimonadia bacterium]|nr:hypothetical protein [Candidatus Saccharimonadia bacterium]
MLVVRYKKLTALFVLLTVVYLVQAGMLPSDSTVLAEYHLANWQTDFIIYALAIPYVAISFISLLGYLGIRDYSKTIRKSHDGEAFHLIANGVLLLALWLPVTAIISMGTSAYADTHRSVVATMANFRDYSNLLILLPAFWFVLAGSKKLLGIVRRSETSFPQPINLIFISFSAIYTALVLRNPPKQFPSHVVFTDTYYLPEWLVVLTIIIPRLIIWYWGVRAVYNIYLYRKRVKGPIYQRALSRLVSGLVLVLVMLSLLRSTQAVSTRNDHMPLVVVLVAAYVLLLLTGFGYFHIAKGAQGLQRIEEI